MNRFEFMPCCIAIATASEETVAAWLDGIPPVRQKDAFIRLRLFRLGFFVIAMASLMN
jgi:hypothetical protein